MIISPSIVTFIKNKKEIWSTDSKITGKIPFKGFTVHFNFATVYFVTWVSCQLSGGDVVLGSQDCTMCLNLPSSSSLGT